MFHALKMSNVTPRTFATANFIILSLQAFNVLYWGAKYRLLGQMTIWQTRKDILWGAETLNSRLESLNYIGLVYNQIMNTLLNDSRQYCIKFVV